MSDKLLRLVNADSLTTLFPNLPTDSLSRIQGENMSEVLGAAPQTQEPSNNPYANDTQPDVMKSETQQQKLECAAEPVETKYEPTDHPGHVPKLTFVQHEITHIGDEIKSLVAHHSPFSKNNGSIFDTPHPDDLAERPNLDFTQGERGKYVGKVGGDNQVLETEPAELPADEHTFDSGAKRSEVKPAYHLIPPEALVRLAKRFSMGAEKYGILNYLRGINDPGFVRQIIDHMHDHLLDFQINGSDKDDNLAGVMWGCAVLMLIEKHNPSVITEAILEPRAKVIADAVAAERPQQNLFEGIKNGAKNADNTKS